MALVGLVGFAVAMVAWGEVPLLSKTDLNKAPEIVVGEVIKIYQRDPAGSGFRRVDFVAELNVVHIEKGTNIKVGDVIYIHYWNQLGKLPKAWDGSRGHDSQMIKEGARIRVHLRLDKQGQREVLLPNGGEAIK